MPKVKNLLHQNGIRSPQSLYELLSSWNYEVTILDEPELFARLVSAGAGRVIMIAQEQWTQSEMVLVRKRSGEQEYLLILAVSTPTQDLSDENRDLPILAKVTLAANEMELHRLIERHFDACQKRDNITQVSDLEIESSSWSLPEVKDVSHKDGALTLTPDVYADLIYRNIYLSLDDLRRLTQVLRGQGEKQDVCRFFDCPRLHQMEAALRETIQVLEGTKGAFKSSQLGALRKKLEKLCDSLNKIR